MVGYHLNFKDSDSAHRFRFLLIPNFDSYKVKSPIAKHLIVAENSEQVFLPLNGLKITLKATHRKSKCVFLIESPGLGN